MAWLSQTDVDNYGNDLIDLTQRSALHAVAPELMEIRQQNEALRQRLAQEARHRMDQQVEQAVPNYREIDRDPNWRSWLLGRDSLSGEVRQHLLNSAIQRGDSTAAIEFFRRFMRESGGGTQSPSAAPGRGRRTSSYDKPTYTRPQIQELYRQHRQGAFTGREAEWARLEHDLIRASAEGRIANPVDINGK